MTPGLRWPLSVPVLTDGEVTLRAHTPDDVAPMVQMSRDPEMQRFTAVPLEYTDEEGERFALEHVPRGWDEGTARGWAIQALDDDGTARFAGNLDLRGGTVAEVGFGLHPWARGRGVMTAAVRLAVDWGFAEGGLESVHWRAHVGNEASLRVAHACGFTLHGAVPALLHERDRVLDGWTASLVFGDPPVPRVPWAESPVLETERLRLRPLVPADAPRIVEACSDPVTRQWLADLPDPYTTRSARAFLDDSVWRAATGRKAAWAVVGRDDDVLLAHVALMGLQGLNPGSAEVGYWAHPQGRGRGLVTEAVRAVVDHALADDGLGLDRLALMAAAGNRASRDVAERCGFREVGRERRAELLGDGSVDDLVVHDLLRSDPR